MIEFAPHTVTVQSYTDDVQASKGVKAPTRGTSTSVPGQLTPKTPLSTFQNWGIELQRPHEFYCELSYAQYFIQGYKVNFNGRTFIVSAPIAYFDVGLGADHCKVLLEEQQFKDGA